MANGERTLKVTIVGDSRQAEQAFQRTGKAAGDAERPLQSVGTRAKAAFGTMASSASMAYGICSPLPAPSTACLVPCSRPKGRAAG